MPPTDSTGIRNNNYLNVKNGSDPWQDAGGQTSRTDDRGHAVFTDPAYGVRAGIILLRSYFFKHNLRTVAEILARWAPASDTVGSLPNAPQNSPVEYSTFVAGRMGISFNNKLDIFKADKTIGNIAQLRALFSAMAEFEIGNGFQVPEDVFNAGLELVQPGITGGGVANAEADAAAEDAATAAVADAAATGDTAAATDPVAVAAATGAAPEDVEAWQIGGSVGSWAKGARNDKEDVETVQEMLRNAAMLVRDAKIDPGSIDGAIARAGRSQTVEGIKAFQSRFMTSPDGLISVGGRTWRELVSVLSHGAEGQTEEAAPDDGTRKFFFPVNPLPKDSWTVAPRCYGSRRSKGARVHAGCDLYAPVGTTIHAITDGTVIRGPYAFYAQTYAIEVDHGDFIARYGEVQGEAFVRKGDKVKAGQPIAKVGRLVGISVPSAMLHLELYDKSADGPLTVPAAQSARDKSGRPFMRRKDLIDPQPKLEKWKSNMPG